MVNSPVPPIITENGEPLVHIDRYAPYVKIAEDPHVIPWVRESVAKMLDAASRALYQELDEDPILKHMASSVSLYVFDALRTEEQQQAYYDHFLMKAREAFPDADEATLREKVETLVAPINPLFPSGHLVGGAVDVRLALTLPGQEGPILIDLTQEYNKPHDHRRPHYDGTNEKYAGENTLGLSDTIVRLRGALRAAMTKVGFSPYNEEYWHFSFGDSLAAQTQRHSAAPYGILDPSAIPQEAMKISKKAPEHAAARFPAPFL